MRVKLAVQRKPAAEQVRSVVSSPGRPLEASVRSFMEPRLGHDFSKVSVHSDAQAAASAEAVRARAYTVGRHVVFGAGAYEPGSSRGRRVIAHELAHVVQQSRGPVGGADTGEGLRISDPDDPFERAADTTAERALTGSTLAAQRHVTASAPSSGGTLAVQRLFDWAIDRAHNRRKVGVEITEDRAGGTNGLGDLDATVAWGALGLPARAAQWVGRAALPDRTGASINWRVSPYGPMAPYFVAGAGAKREWMKWGPVKLTEDYGDFEWIVSHPPEPQGVTYYRDRLADVSRARAALRHAVGGHGTFALAMNDNPGADQALYLSLSATNAASAQITFESTDRAATKRALLEGLSSGLERRTRGGREALADADPAVAATITAAAAHIGAYGGGVTADTELIMAYIVADLCHKAATLLTGPAWAGAIAANFKQWRTLFPKSHPTQVTYQALNGVITVPALAAISVALLAQQAPVVQDIANLFATKFMANPSPMQQEWELGNVPGQLDPAGPYPHNVLYAAMMGLALPVGAPGGGGLATVAAALHAFLNLAQPNFLATEYANAVAALTDHTLVARDVVRSTGFAVHNQGNRGVAFEDRAEVATAFPGLSTTYERLKAIVDRY